MRRLLFSAAAIVGVFGGGLAPAMATPLANSGFSSQNVEGMPVEKVGYWRRHYRRYGYAVPYAYYPPTYGYYAPPPAYGYYAPPAAANGDYSSANVGYGDYPTANGDYGDRPPASGDYPTVNGDYGDRPPASGDYPTANDY